MKRLLSLSMSLMIAMLSLAHDFEVDGICYNITSSSEPYTVAVTFKGGYISQYVNVYTGDVNIPESVTYEGKIYSVTSIGNESFYDCSGLTSIDIPNSVTSIGSNAFYGTAWFDNQPNGVVYAGKVAYQYKGTMPAKTSIVLEEGTLGIADNAFAGCSGLTSITIPNSVTSIGKFAFWGCSGLTSVTIPNSVTSIGNSTFSGCSGLTSVTIPNSVTSIGDNAFNGCSGLTSVTIPNSVTSIGSNAFYGTAWYDNQPDGVVYAGKVAYQYKGTMPENASIVLEEGTLGIAPYAFMDCSDLTSIDFPNSVMSIGDYAFYNCTSLISVSIPESVTSIGYDAFHGCSGLTSVNIPNSVITIHTSAFESCKSLTSITIPNSVTTIDGYAFQGCRSLTSVILGNNVTSIGWVAFAYCSGLKEITSYLQEPFTVFSNCWEGVPKDIPLYVPVGTKEKYQSAEDWKDFTNIIEFGGDVIEPTEEAKEVDMAAVPDQMELNGMVVGDTYYALNKDNGDGADKEDGCVVINSITTDEAVSSIVGKEISDESVKDAFKGIIFMVPAGTGKVSVTGQTIGSSSLMVKVGSQPAQAFQLAERETVQIPYTVTEPTYVYIYAGTSVQGARAQGATTAAAAENSVKVYSYKWEPTETTGINSIHNSQFTIENEAGAWYTLDGRKLNGKPAQKGVYIVNGRKVAIK